MNGERAQSEVVGTVMVLGLSLLVIGVSLAAGTAALSASSDDAELRQVENAMSQVSSKTSLVALGDSDRQHFNLGSVNRGDVELMEDAGFWEVRIEYQNASDVTVANGTFGALVYENGDREVAMEGGGVWRKDDGVSQMVSPPEYHYRGNTLTFPIVTLEPGDSQSHSPTGTLTQPTTPTSIYPNASEGLSNPLLEGTVIIEIESRYYHGWYDFFAERAEGQTEIVDEDGETGTVVTELAVPIELTPEVAVGYQSNADYSGNAEADSDEQGTYRSPGPMIQGEIESASDESNNDNDQTNCIENDEWNQSGTCSFSSGTYFVDGDVVTDGDIEFDTSDGDIEFVIDGNFDIQGDQVRITDVEGDGTVEYFISGSFGADGGNSYLGVGDEGEDIQPARNILWVNEGVFDDEVGQGNTFIEAIIYAPNAEIETAGTPEIHGSLIADSIDFSGNTKIKYHDSVGEVTLDLTDGESRITFLHVSENSVEVELE